MINDDDFSMYFTGHGISSLSAKDSERWESRRLLQDFDIDSTTLMKCRLGPMLKKNCTPPGKRFSTTHAYKNLTQSTSSFGSIAWGWKQEIIIVFLRNFACQMINVSQWKQHLNMITQGVSKNFTSENQFFKGRIPYWNVYWIVN